MQTQCLTKAPIYTKTITDYGKIRVSLRSVPELAINEVAGTFGGGGHRQASGCTIYGCLEYAEQKIIEVIDDFLKRNGFN